jgi:ligand-binding sensor domain-containing protein
VRRSDQKPDENNGIVRIERTDWARMKVIAEEQGLAGTQEVFEAIYKSIGYRENIPDEQIVLAVKLYKMKNRK